ncbi:membrane protein insertase YidC [Chitinispirillales bacterium ANBcel5]|uniref:membrane protein insertase YidC n=1 Tax=Cellulosispirillum alkaliphilum TaxID=3039283 RepID=UPI002A506429|nr:membrane protein insertase YidC [Chitinispirillales bacterium ANBcel5]
MNKNTMLAFVLIMATLMFFTSPAWNRFYYENILGRPYPEQIESVQQEIQEEDEIGDIADTPQQGELQVASSEDETEASEEDRAAAVEEEIEKDTIWIETDRIRAQISTKGARVISLQMKGYNVNGLEEGQEFDIIPEGSEGGAQLTINTESFDERMFEIVDEEQRDIKVEDSPYTLTLKTTSEDGEEIRKIFTFENDTYKIGYDVEGENLDGKKVVIGWIGGVGESESPQGGIGSPVERRRIHYYNGNRVEHLQMNEEGVEETTGNYKWLGMTSKYFFVNLITDELRDMDLKIEAVEQERIIPGNDQKIEEINYSITMEYFADGNRVSNSIFAGPNSYSILRSYDLSFEKVLFPVLNFARHILWADVWFPPVAEFVLRVLLFLQGIVKDFGIAIILLTLLSRLITYPLTHSSTKSMNRMRDVQPKINALRQKYKNNPQKMNQELMALYKAEGINPLNPGCLPMFLQMPIFIALFVVLRKAVELRGADTFLVPWINDLSQPEVLFSLPFSVPLYGGAVALLPILMAVLTYFQNKMTIKDPNQKAMIYFMPVFMLVLFNNFPAGLVLYWTMSSGFGLLQQYLVGRKKTLSPAVAVGNVNKSKKVLQKKK